MYFYKMIYFHNREIYFSFIIHNFISLSKFWIIYEFDFLDEIKIDDHIIISCFIYFNLNLNSFFSNQNFKKIKIQDI